MKIKWIGQSGYIVKTVKNEIIIDPYLSDFVNEVAGRERLFPAPMKPEKIRADVVVCTHNHLDHLDVGAISKMREEQLFITTDEGKEKLAELSRHNVRTLKVGECITVGDIEIEAVYANHTVEAFGIILRAEGTTLYFSGDTLFDEKLFEVAAFQPDIAFLCINGKLGNMNVEEAVVVANKIGAKVNVPNHYDMFASNSEDPRKFTDNLKNGCIMELDKEYDTSEIRQYSHHGKCSKYIEENIKWT